MKDCLRNEEMSIIAYSSKHIAVFLLMSRISLSGFVSGGLIKYVHMDHVILL